jgi:hypothetical protein
MRLRGDRDPALRLEDRPRQDLRRADLHPLHHPPGEGQGPVPRLRAGLGGLENPEDRHVNAAVKHRGPEPAVTTLQPFQPCVVATSRARPIAAIEVSPSQPLRRNPIPPPPKIAWLALDQLVIDEGYQRGLSNRSTALIRRLVERWDWNCFKPLSVAAAGGGLYEIIDGQHTAIAAATHGAIETLPCLVLDASTVAQRAAAFVGINRDRVAL